MNWGYLVVALWMVGLLAVALMHDRDLRKGLKELEVQNYELRGKMLNMLEYMIEMNKNDREMLENVQGMAKTFKNIESQNYGEILNLRDDIRDYSKAVETQMESVGEAQLKVVEAIEHVEKVAFPRVCSIKEDFFPGTLTAWNPEEMPPLDMNDNITKSVNPTCADSKGSEE